jgi:Tol biopolymer transport system component
MGGGIYTMPTDGSRIGFLFDSPPGEYTWSPDGKYLAFVGVTVVGNQQYRPLFMMNADGSGKKQLTSATSYISRPAWSGDGRKVYYYSLESGIHSLDPASGTDRLLLSKPHDEFFYWAVGGPTPWVMMPLRGGGYEFYDPEGGFKAPKVIIPDATPNCAVSPSGDELAFIRYEEGYYSQIFIAEMDGSGEEQLTDDSFEHLYPCWSPDGKKILFNGTPDNGNPYLPRDIYVIGRDGTGEVKLTDLRDLLSLTPGSWQVN